jgi:hypothetical protein
MAIDMRFKNTWLRQRHDLKDQTSSGYDLALTDFGISNKLPEQQIVDLIIHHRAHYRQKARTRLDYFQRTINKAYRRTWGGMAPPPPIPTPGTDDLDAPQPSPETVKALLCERISQSLHIDIVRLVKITGKEPTYHMELATGAKIEFDSVRKFIAQESVRMAVAGTVGKLIPHIRDQREWERIAQMMLDACYVEQGSVEDEFEAGARTEVASYLSDTGFIEAIETEQVQNQKKPILIDGQIAVNATDLANYLKKTQLMPITPKAVGSRLKAMGAKQRRLCGRKFKEQSRWMLPLVDFDPADYPAGQKKEQESGDAAIH